MISLPAVSYLHLLIRKALAAIRNQKYTQYQASLHRQLAGKSEPCQVTDQWQSRKRDRSPLAAAAVRFGRLLHSRRAFSDQKPCRRALRRRICHANGGSMNSKTVQDAFHGYRKPVYRPSAGDIQDVLFRPSREVRPCSRSHWPQRRDFQP